MPREFLVPNRGHLRPAGSHRRRLPTWALPLAGGTLVTLIAILWSSAALWQLTQP
ncbi:DUF6529 family protein [Streptosporangium sp. NPDC002607]